MPTIKLDPNAICVRIETTLQDQDSFVNITLDSGDGNGYVNVTDPTTNQRCGDRTCVILRQCYDTVAGIQLQGPSPNGWKGSIKWTTNGGNSFNRFECVPGECSGTNDPRDNTDFTVSGGQSPNGGVECLDGKVCTLLRTVTNTPTSIPTESPSELPTNQPMTPIPTFSPTSIPTSSPEVTAPPTISSIPSSSSQPSTSALPSSQPSTSSMPSTSSLPSSQPSESTRPSSSPTEDTLTDAPTADVLNQIPTYSPSLPIPTYSPTLEATIPVSNMCSFFAKIWGILFFSFLTSNLHLLLDLLTDGGGNYTHLCPF